jgi:GSH-dependent disulfide-bond oxidoreductase
VLELYGAKTGNCLRAAVGLSEAGLTYEVRKLSLSEGEHRSAAHLALNPVGKVPVLVIRGTPDVIITQSSAILFYASEQAPGRLLPPPGSLSRIKALEAFFHFTSDVIAANGFAFNLRDNDAAAAALTRRSVDSLLTSERFLSEAGFMGGDTFSMADIAGFTITTAVSNSLPWDKLPRLAAWRDRIAQRPAVQRAMTAFG